MVNALQTHGNISKVKYLQRLQSKTLLAKARSKYFTCKRRSTTDAGIIAPGHQLFQFGIGHPFVRSGIEQEYQIIFNARAMGSGKKYKKCCGRNN